MDVETWGKRWHNIRPTGCRAKKNVRFDGIPTDIILYKISFPSKITAPETPGALVAYIFFLRKVLIHI